MICRHCGKEFSDDFEYCPYCAEPVTFWDKHPMTDEQHKELKKEVARTKKGCAIVLLGIVLFPISWVAIYLWNFVDLILNDADYYGGWMISLYAFLISTTVVVVGLLVEHLKSDKQKLIDIQFDEDATSICPKCGSHNIKVYRKGYNYKKGFWLRLFDVKGGAYIAGMDSNTTCCRCMNCCNDWETDYDYRLIDK